MVWVDAWDVGNNYSFIVARSFRVVWISDFDFSDSVSSGDELLSRYGLAADEFVESWLAFSAMKYNGDSPSLETLSQFDTEVLARKKSASGPVPSSRLKDLDDSLVIHDSTSIRHL